MKTYITLILLLCVIAASVSAYEQKVCLEYNKQSTSGFVSTLNTVILDADVSNTALYPLGCHDAYPGGAESLNFTFDSSGCPSALRDASNIETVEDGIHQIEEIYNMFSDEVSESVSSAENSLNTRACVDADKCIIVGTSIGYCSEPTVQKSCPHFSGVKNCMRIYLPAASTDIKVDNLLYPVMCKIGAIMGGYDTKCFKAFVRRHCVSFELAAMKYVKDVSKAEWNVNSLLNAKYIRIQEFPVCPASCDVIAPLVNEDAGSYGCMAITTPAGECVKGHCGNNKMMCTDTDICIGTAKHSKCVPKLPAGRDTCPDTYRQVLPYDIDTKICSNYRECRSCLAVSGCGFCGTMGAGVCIPTDIGEDYCVYTNDIDSPLAFGALKPWHTDVCRDDIRRVKFGVASQSAFLYSYGLRNETEELQLNVAAWHLAAKADGIDHKHINLAGAFARAQYRPDILTAEQLRLWTNVNILGVSFMEIIEYDDTNNDGKYTHGTDAAGTNGDQVISRTKWADLNWDTPATPVTSTLVDGVVTYQLALTSNEDFNNIVLRCTITSGLTATRNPYAVKCDIELTSMKTTTYSYALMSAMFARTESFNNGDRAVEAEGMAYDWVDLVELNGSGTADVQVNKTVVPWTNREFFNQAVRRETVDDMSSMIKDFENLEASINTGDHLENMQKREGEPPARPNDVDVLKGKVFPVLPTKAQVVFYSFGTTPFTSLKWDPTITLGGEALPPAPAPNNNDDGDATTGTAATFAVSVIAMAFAFILLM